MFLGFKKKYIHFQVSFIAKFVFMFKSDNSNRLYLNSVVGYGSWKGNTCKCAAIPIVWLIPDERGSLCSVTILKTSKETLIRFFMGVHLWTFMSKCMYVTPVVNQSKLKSVIFFFNSFLIFFVITFGFFNPDLKSSDQKWITIISVKNSFNWTSLNSL